MFSNSHVSSPLQPRSNNVRAPAGCLWCFLSEAAKGYNHQGISSMHVNDYCASDFTAAVDSMLQLSLFRAEWPVRTKHDA